MAVWPRHKFRGEYLGTPPRFDHGQKRPKDTQGIIPHPCFKSLRNSNAQAALVLRDEARQRNENLPDPKPARRDRPHARRLASVAGTTLTLTAGRTPY